LFQTGLILSLLFIFPGAQGGVGGATPATITGILFDRGVVTDAEIDLQLLQDEHCAKLFGGARRGAQEQRELQACSRDLASTHPDAQGHYRFSDLAPGWYAIHFVWSMAEKPRRPGGFKRGEWEVMYPGYKDKTGKYDAFAQGKPFFVSGPSETIKDYKNP
jgi:hypothetical protein